MASDAIRRAAAAIRRHDRDLVENQVREIEYAQVTRSSPLSLDLFDSSISLDEDDLTLSQWVRAYQSSVGIKAGDRLAITKMRSGGWLAVDVIGRKGAANMTGGVTGPKGDKGDKGDPGEKGDPGDPGDGAGPPGDWEPLDLETGWVDLSDLEPSFAPSGFYLDESAERVYLRGAVSMAAPESSAEVIATGLPLPAGGNLVWLQPAFGDSPLLVISIQAGGELVVVGEIAEVSTTVLLSPLTYRYE